MKSLIYTILFLAVTFSGFTQSFEGFMQSVEQNNPRLMALDKWLEAEATLAKTGIYPDNPEVSYNYLFGSPEAIGDQKELEITQSFRLPGYYTSKSALQKLDYQQKQALAEKEKQEVLHAARRTYFSLVWLQKKEALLENRKENADKLLKLMKAGFDRGEISKPVYDKARIYAIGVQTDYQRLQSEMKAQHQYLQQLNGGKPIEGLSFSYPLDWELPELDTLLTNLSAKNPNLIRAGLNIQQAEKEIEHQRIKSLPSFEAGYVSETILNQKLRGIHAGISIPLWQNKNTVKYAKLQTEASKADFSQKESELKAEVSALFFEAKALKDSYEQMKLIMEEEAISDSSLELLQAGQISFTEYLVEIEMINSNRMRYIDYQKDLFTRLSALKAMVN
ncbi:TolC family protein [uncultured Sunxiuqinia sp.]|uniref:TolC family protein n=1 Tax=uncultured Sunxiuqinia sp. TaxID=1573825 RepID=UPI0030DA981B